MLGKCSNPSCSAPFRYLQNGRLFRLEGDPICRLSKPGRVEYFWLCDRCSSTMTLRISNEGKVLPIVLASPVRADADQNGINLVDRREGLLLSKLNFSTKGARTGAVFFG